MVHGIVVDFAALRSLISGIDDRIENTTSILDKLGQQIAALTTLWDGAAAEGFRATQSSWFTAADDLRIRLAELRELVCTAHDNHAVAVRTNTRIWRV